MLEWRWPIHGRNTTVWAGPVTPADLHRQNELVTHYTRGAGTHRVVGQRPPAAPRRPAPYPAHVTVCEPALPPSPGAVSLLFPVADHVLDAADPAALAACPELALAYVGNQYDRDDTFDAFFAPAAARYRHLVAGKWTRTAQWPRASSA